MKKLIALALTVMLLMSAFPFLGVAEGTENLFRVGETLKLFEKDGVSVSLAGGIVMLDMSKTFPILADVRDDEASVALTAIVENCTDKNLFIEYTGSVNGVSLGSGEPLVNIHALNPDSRNATYIVFRKDRLNGEDARQLKSCELTFRVYEKPTNLNDDNVLLFEVPVGVIRFDQAPYAGLSWQKGKGTVILAQNGLQIELVTVKTSKDCTYVLMGCKVTNNTNSAALIRYTAKVNGWDVGGFRNTPMLSGGNELKSIDSGKSVELIMPITMATWATVRADPELESLNLTFEVSRIDKSGKETPWFTSSTGTIWINRASGTEEAPAAVETVGEPESVTSVAEPETVTATGEPEAAPPEENKFRLMYDLEFGDDEKTVREKVKEAGGSVYLESGALHGKADLFDLPGDDYDYLLSDGGKLKCIRIMCMMDDKTPADAEPFYQSVKSQLTRFFGEPNGRGSTEALRSTNDMFMEIAATITSGVYYNCLQHDEWYIQDAEPYPLKIDLFFERSGNTEAGTGSTVIELDIEAQGV